MLCWNWNIGRLGQGGGHGRVASLGRSPRQHHRADEADVSGAASST